MLHIALTGGIASGKSTVSRMFARLGVPVIQLDEIARNVVEPGSPGLAAVIKEFGQRFLDKHGRLNRQLLREYIFQDDNCRHRLEMILHPLIRDAMEMELALLDEQTPYAIIEIPLLVETGNIDNYDRVLVVDCTEEAQRKRLMDRDKVGQSQIEQVFSAQASRNQRLDVADDVIDNSSVSLADLENQVASLDARYRELAAS
jgi:dephospho-CoA kinase